MKYFNKELLHCLIIGDYENEPSGIAEKIGINFKTLYNWRAGEVMPHARMLKKLADYFKVDVNLFLKKCNTEKFNQGLIEKYKKEYVFKEN